MRKLEKLLNDLTEKKVTNWKMHKRKKAFVAFVGVLAVGLGTAGLVYASAQRTSARLVYQRIQRLTGKITSLCIMKSTKQAKSTQNLCLN